MKEHEYQTHLVWEGSTGAGYARYSRDHRAVAPPAEQELRLSADPQFRGSAALTTPEQLLVMAASSCQLLSFLACAARGRVDVLSYEDDARGLMPHDASPQRITSIQLAPTIVVAPGTQPQDVVRMVHEAHGQCYIVNSLSATVTVEPTVVVREAAAP